MRPDYPHSMVPPKPTLPTESEIGEPAGPTQSSLWRQDQLLRAGYDPLHAALLAASNVDLHVAVELVTKQGCDPETAFAILS